MFDEDFDDEDDELSEREYAARDEFNSTQAQLCELLERTGARRVEVKCGGVGLCQLEAYPRMGKVVGLQIRSDESGSLERTA